jgi:hypothetical protein
MAESTVQIKLTTSADTSGALQAASAMDKVETGIKEVGQESKKTELTIRQLEAELRKTQEALRDLTPSDARLPALRQQIDQLEVTLGKAGVGGQNFGFAMMNAGRGIQDFQAAGLPGVLNNVEGLTTSMGGPAGLAGVLTIVAVGFQVLRPHIAAFFNDLDTEGKKLDDLKAKLSAAATAVLGEWTPATQAADDASHAFTEKLAAEKAALDALEGSLKSSLGLLKERNKLTQDIGKNEDEAKIEDIKAQGLPEDEEARQIARVKIERLNADKAAAEGELVAEKKVVDENVSNADAAAKQAEAQRKKLEAEKQRALLQATLEQEIGGTVDEKGNTVKKGAAERVADAEKNLAGAESLRGKPGIDPAFAEEQRINAQDQLKQEQQRLDDLTKESRDNIAANGGQNFREIKDIDAEISQQEPAVKAAEAKREAARKAQAELDANMDLRQRKIGSDYNRDAEKVLKTLPPEPEPQRVQRVEPTPFDIAERDAAGRKPRNLAAEEAAGLGKKSTGRDLVAEETQAAAESNRAANEAVLAALKQMQADNKKLTEQLKNSRS